MGQPENDFRLTSRARQILSSSLPAVSLVFLYGTLMACSLLAWLVTGDATQKDAIEGRRVKAVLHGYIRRALRGADYPALPS